MARAAAKRGRTPHPKPKADAHRRDRRPGGGGGVEQTLFFQRIRRQAKWVFVFLAFVFAGSFVVYGVGSGSTGIGDLLRGDFGGIFGGGSSSGVPSVDKAQKEVAKNPKSPKAYRDLARAYEQQSDDLGAIGALESYLKLRPKDAGALRELAAEYDNRTRTQYAQLQDAQAQVEAAQPTTFGPAPNTKLGQAFSASPNPISNALSQAANTRYSDAQQGLLTTLKTQEGVFAKIVELDPTDSTTLLQYAQSAQQAQDTTAALAAYKKFLKLFPDDPSAAYAKQQVKSLGGTVSPSSGG